METLWIGTRGSRLALWQAEWVKARIEEKHSGLSVHLKVIHTTGDKILDVPLAKVGGKGLFVKEIEEELLAGEVDLAVHSMKDVPTGLPPGLEIGFYAGADDPRDALVSREGKKFSDLPHGARIGTSSLRRMSQLLHARPDLRISSLRGNVETRLRKLEEENLDAVIMAAAGLSRLGLEGRITEALAVSLCLPPVGQGVLGIEVRADDPSTRKLLSFFEDPEARVRLSAERSFLKRLEGGCQVPIGAHATVSSGRVRLEGMVAGLDGREMFRDVLEGPSRDAEQIGVTLAEKILGMGGRKVLDEVYRKMS